MQSVCQQHALVSLEHPNQDAGARKHAGGHWLASLASTPPYHFLNLATRYCKGCVKHGLTLASASAFE